MEWTTGIPLGIAIVLLLAITAVVALRASARKREAERIHSVAEALSRGGFAPSDGAEIPSEAPDWEIAPRSRRTTRAIRVERGDASAYVFDHTQINEGYSGWNMESSSGGDAGSTRTYRHTLACLHAPALALPSFSVMPNVRTKMHDLVDDSASELGAEGYTKSASALAMLMGIVGSFVAAEEKPGAWALPNDPELSASFHLYGEDEAGAGGLVVGAMRDRLLSTPGLILEARGSWLIATFHVGLAFGNSTDETPPLSHGLLSAEQTLRLVELAFQLRDDLAALPGLPVR